jgi:hypothetical protein
MAFGSALDMLLGCTATEVAMKDDEPSNVGSLFEFSEPGGETKWVATPGRQSTFPLSIRNDTGEGHDVAVIVEEPANWAWAEPHRVSLDPGDSTTVSIIFAPQKETTVAAGVHQAAIRLRDLEGVIFAECMRTFEVEEHQELAMTVTLRGPLMSFGMAEGFVLHCTLENRGNVDVTVAPVGDPHPALTFSKRTVSVPFQGQVSFDIEVRWNAARRTNHPDTITLRARYRDGEASASIDWSKIAEALEPFMPIYSRADAEDELLSLSWLPQPGEDVLEHKLPDFMPEEVEPAAAAVTPEPVVGVAAAAAPSPLTTPPPELAAARRKAAYPPAKRISPWWPVLHYLGGRWRVKPLPILMTIIAIEGFVIGMTQAERDYYASPSLTSRIPAITRAFRASSHAASALVGFGKSAIAVTLNEGGKLANRFKLSRHMSPAVVAQTPPALWGLSAHYVNPRTLAVSFNQVHCTNLSLLVASGRKVLYHRSLALTKALVPIPKGLTAPVRVTVVAQAPDGLELRQHVYLAPPFATRG